MRVVIDSNVLFSALIVPGSIPDGIYQYWLGGRFDLITAPEQIDEIVRASRYPKFRKNLHPAKIGKMINHLRAVAQPLRLNSDAEASDPFDSFLLAMAEAGNADYLVTGDSRSGLIKLGSHARARIVTPRQFAEVALGLRSAR